MTEELPEDVWAIYASAVGDGPRIEVKCPGLMDEVDLD